VLWDGFNDKEQQFAPRDFSPGLRSFGYALLPLAEAEVLKNRRLESEPQTAKDF